MISNAQGTSNSSAPIDAEEAQDLRRRIRELEDRLMQFTQAPALTQAGAARRLRSGRRRVVQIGVAALLVILGGGSMVLAQSGIQGIFVDRSGNVGIGTTEPGKNRLRVNGGVDIAGELTAQRVVMDGPITGGEVTAKRIVVNGPISGGEVTAKRIVVDGSISVGEGAATVANKPLRFVAGSVNGDTLEISQTETGQGYSVFHIPPASNGTVGTKCFPRSDQFRITFSRSFNYKPAVLALTATPSTEKGISSTIALKSAANGEIVVETQDSQCRAPIISFIVAGPA